MSIYANISRLRSRGRSDQQRDILTTNKSNFLNTLVIYSYISLPVPYVPVLFFVVPAYSVTAYKMKQ